MADKHGHGFLHRQNEAEKRDRTEVRRRKQEERRVRRLLRKAGLLDEDARALAALAPAAIFKRAVVALRAEQPAPSDRAAWIRQAVTTGKAALGS